MVSHPDVRSRQLRTIPASKPYSGFEGQYIGGALRSGRSGRPSKDTDPYNGETVAEIAEANQSDLDEAYRAAAEAQPQWADALPAEREVVLLRAAGIMEARREEIISWLARESGSARVKSEIEW
jgi:aldehyde dehydrogenase (NAD+)